MRFYLSLIFLLILVAIAFIFGSQNNQELTLNYLIAKQEMTVASAVSLFTTIGFLLGILFSLLWKFSAAIRKRRKQPLQAK